MLRSASLKDVIPWNPERKFDMNRYFMLLVLAVAYVHNMPLAVADLIRGQDLPLYYDFRNGNVTVDTTEVHGSSMIGYGFRVPFDGFLIENWTPFMDTFFISGTEREFGETNMGGISPGVYSLGNVIPAGLSEEELGEYFGPQGPFNRPTSRFQYYAAGALGSQTYHHFSPQYSPSPFPPLNDPSVGPPEVDRWAREITLAYDAATGELALDASGENGGHFMQYYILLKEDVVATEAFTPITDFAAVASPNRITELGLDPIPGGYYSLGNVLPAGLDEEQLFPLFATAAFRGEPTHGNLPLDINTHGIDMALNIVPEPTIDFNQDGKVDFVDTDALVAEIVDGTNRMEFDLSGDGSVDDVDLTQWLSEAATHNQFGEPYLRGDSNLDGTVNATDLSNVALNWQQYGRSWSAGDFQVDGSVNAADLSKLALNWQQTIPMASMDNAPIPEPSAYLLTILGCAMVWRRARCS